MLTHFRFTVLPPVVDALRAVKTEVEIQGLKRAHLRDGVCFVRMLAWLEERLAGGYAVSEWEAANRLTEYRRKAKNFMMLAYENISASGPNACESESSSSSSCVGGWRVLMAGFWQRCSIIRR